MNLILNYERVSALPFPVRAFCHGHEAWIVGGAASWLLGLSQDPPKDYDLLIPLWNWNVACKAIPEGTPSNSQGGFKLQEGGVILDVWGSDIGSFLAQVPYPYLPSYAVQPKSMRYLSVGGLNSRRGAPLPSSEGARYDL